LQIRLLLLVIYYIGQISEKLIHKKQTYLFIRFAFLDIRTYFFLNKMLSHKETATPDYSRIAEYNPKLVKQ